MIAAVRRGLALAVFLSLFGVQNAWADETITAIFPNRFLSAVTTIDQGEKVTLRNLDMAGHDVTSHHTGDDGKPLFGSALVGPGMSGPVAQTEYLTTGSYEFFCSIHPGMEATLEVTSAGTPVERPQAEGVQVKVLSTDLDRVVERGKLKLKVASRKGSVLVGARAEKRKGSIALGSKKIQFEEKGVRRIALKLSDAARKALGKRERATVIATATANHSDGHTERTTARRTLD
jgi:plastocyanin